MLQGTMKDCKPAMRRQGQGQEFLHYTLGLFSFGLSVFAHKVISSQRGSGYI